MLTRYLNDQREARTGPLAAALRECDDLLVNHGGHAMAAGMSIQSEHYQEFCQAFDAEIKRQLTQDDLQAVLL